LRVDFELQSIGTIVKNRSKALPVIKLRQAWLIFLLVLDTLGSDRFVVARVVRILCQLEFRHWRHVSAKEFVRLGKIFLCCRPLKIGGVLADANEGSLPVVFFIPSRPGVLRNLDVN
jgi:hypothetical protein